MTSKSVLKELKSMGTAQNRKIYARHGVSSPMFGVSYANLNKLRKSIKKNHEVAMGLWASGNHDARVLATMIADPQEMKASTINAWSRELDNYVLTDAFGSLVGRTSHARGRLEKWTGARDEWQGRAGWHLVASAAIHDEDLPDDYFAGQLAIIEAEIHSRKNRVRDAMNTALISIGLRNKKLEKKAIAAAKKIGKVEVDHGETSCKTPDATGYIKKAAARKKAKRR